MLCIPWLRWKHPEWERPIKVTTGHIYSIYTIYSIYSTAVSTVSTVLQYRVHCNIQVSLVWPVLYILATVFITIVPMVAKPLETGLGCLIILTAVPVYFIFLYWENKPPAIRKFLSKNIMLSVRQGIDMIDIISQKN